MTNEQKDLLDGARERMAEASQLAGHALSDPHSSIAVEQLAEALKRLAQSTNRLILFAEN